MFIGKISKVIDAIYAWHDGRCSLSQIVDYLGEDYQGFYNFMFLNELCDVRGNPEERITPEYTIHCLTSYMACRQTKHFTTAASVKSQRFGAGRR